MPIPIVYAMFTTSLCRVDYVAKIEFSASAPFFFFYFFFDCLFVVISFTFHIFFISIVHLFCVPLLLWLFLWLIRSWVLSIIFRLNSMSSPIFYRCEHGQTVFRPVYAPSSCLAHELKTLINSSYVSSNWTWRITNWTAFFVSLSRIQNCWIKMICQMNLIVRMAMCWVDGNHSSRADDEKAHTGDDFEISKVERDISINIHIVIVHTTVLSVTWHWLRSPLSQRRIFRRRTAPMIGLSNYEIHWEKFRLKLNENFVNELALRFWFWDFWKHFSSIFLMKVI